MDQERLSGALQENVLTLLCYSESSAKLIRHSVSAQLFESSIFRKIAESAIGFIDQFDAPIGDHLADELDSILNGTDARKAKTYADVLNNMREVHATINTDYVMASLHKFVRQQKLKDGLVRAVQSVQDGDLDAAEVVLQRCLKDQSSEFEAGTVINDPRQALRFLETRESNTILTGIAPLDRFDIGPTPKEMFLIIAPPKRGKTWAMIHLGKWGLLQRKRVLHISLEMSEERISQRYIQAIFSVSKRKVDVRRTFLRTDAEGALVRLEFEDLQRPALDDPATHVMLARELPKRLGKKPPLIVKQFPTRALTIPGLESYLDSLERFNRFVPDMLIVDYPDLMKIDSNNLRIDTGRIFQDLRGLAVSRNFALVVATQGNRESASAKIVTDSMVSEDWSKIASADNVITFSQSDAERAAGLARLFVSNGRNDEDKFVISITQAYAIGQFALSAELTPYNYWETIDGTQGRSRGASSE